MRDRAANLRAPAAIRDSGLEVGFSDTASLAEWPGIQGLDLEGSDERNHIGVVFLPWVYILSVRWAELLGRSREYVCRVEYDSGAQTRTEQLIQGVLEGYDKAIFGNGTDEETRWWYAVLVGDKGGKYLRSITKRHFYHPGPFLFPIKFSTKDQFLVIVMHHHRLRLLLNT